MIYLITGATGLVGKHIVKRCEQQNITVHYLTTSKSKIKTTPTYKGFFWDPKSGYIDKEAFAGVSTVIHLAGASVAKRWTKAHKQQILESRILPTNLLKTVLSEINHTVSQFISASAIGIYSDSLLDFHDEDSGKLGDDFLATVVKKWEHAVDQIADLGIAITKLRLGIVLDEKEGALPKMVQPIKLYFGAAFAKGDQWQSWIHINDLSAMFMYVANEKLTGVFNAVAPNAVSQNKLIASCAEILNKPLWLPNIPKFMVKLMLGEMSTIVLASQRVDCSKIQEEGFLFEFPSLRKALQFLFKKQKNHSL